MKTFEQKFTDYAKLVVNTGLNIQKSQNLIINAPIMAHDFVVEIVRHAYEAGVKEIFYRWNSEQLDLIRYENADESVFNTFPEWVAKGYEEVARDNTAVLTIYASNPELLKDVDPNRIKNDTKTRSLAFKSYRDFVTNGGCNWCIVSIPTKGWANSIFKSDDTENNINKLWDLIFKMNRVDQDDPIKAWKEHVNNLDKYQDFLNYHKFKNLHYKSDKTNLTVNLHHDHIWLSAEEKTASGIKFIANMPTEEVFTLPHKYGVNGVLYSTLPLQYAGNTIDGMHFTFENGKIVDFGAETGYELLKDLIDSDEGSKYLGEVAIVSTDSPIYKSNITFINTLYDENASCHFAIGSAYPNTIKNGENFSSDEKEKYGVNDSIVHVDFMVGDEKLSIIGEKNDGTLIKFFVNGKWNI